MKSILFLMVLLGSLSLQAKNCVYEFDMDKSMVQGTGFKFTEKKGVTGSFTKFTLNKTEKKSAIKDLINGLEVTVDLMTLDSGNALRDKNMRETLFAYIVGDASAKVVVQSVSDKKIETVLNLNEKSVPVSFDYTIKDGVVEAKGSFDALTLAMNEGIENLKKRCGSLHTGSDGKSVTWTTFDLSVKAVTKKICK